MYKSVIQDNNDHCPITLLKSNPTLETLSMKIKAKSMKTTAEDTKPAVSDKEALISHMPYCEVTCPTVRSDIMV